MDRQTERQTDILIDDGDQHRPQLTVRSTNCLRLIDIFQRNIVSFVGKLTVSLERLHVAPSRTLYDQYFSSYGFFNIF